MNARRRTAWPVALLAIAATLSGCGSSVPRGDSIPGRVLTIYTSLPLTGLSGAAGRDALRGEQLALLRAGPRLGRYTLRLRVLDDATAQSGLWDPGLTTQNARLAAADPSTAGYLGELDAGASAVSIPLLNRLTIAQVSPSGGAVGLTQGGPGAAPGEPEKYYPAGRRTFVRIAPNDAVEAHVQLQLLRESGCSSAFIVQDDEVDGEDFAATYEALAPARGISIAGAETWVPGANDLAMATAAAASGARCVVLSVLPRPGLAGLVRSLLRAPTRPVVLGTSTLAEGSLSGAASRSGRVVLTAPAPDPGQAARSFSVAYAARFGASASPSAVCGYAAMQLLLAAIDRATGHGRHTAQRSRITDALFGRRRVGLLGSYRISPEGDTSISRLGVYVPAARGLMLQGALTG